MKFGDGGVRSDNSGVRGGSGGERYANGIIGGGGWNLSFFCLPNYNKERMHYYYYYYY